MTYAPRPASEVRGGALRLQGPWGAWGTGRGTSCLHMDVRPQ